MDTKTLVADLVNWLTPLGLALVIIVLGFWLVRRALPIQSGGRLTRQMAHIVLTVIAIILIILMLPFDDDTQGQLISLFGLVLTAVVALASSNFASNAMSGLMLRAVGSFQAGDFIRVEGHFGRVTEKSLLHTEIQTEDRDLITLPNLYLINHPVQVVHASGTLISCDVSLGYDVHRRQIADLLREAASKTELSEPFVQVLELGDFTVVYRVSGFLEEVRGLVSKRSELRGKVLDTLHEAQIEIASPNIMLQRPSPADQPLMPKRYYGSSEEDDTGAAEKLMFEKAELAARIERLRAQRTQLAEDLEALKEQDGDNELELTWRKKQIEALDELLNAEEEPQ